MGATCSNLVCIRGKNFCIRHTLFSPMWVCLYWPLLFLWMGGLLPVSCCQVSSLYNVWNNNRLELPIAFKKNLWYDEFAYWNTDLPDQCHTYHRSLQHLSVTSTLFVGGFLFIRCIIYCLFENETRHHWLHMFTRHQPQVVSVWSLLSRNFVAVPLTDYRISPISHNVNTYFTNFTILFFCWYFCVYFV